GSLLHIFTAVTLAARSVQKAAADSRAAYMPSGNHDRDRPVAWHHLDFPDLGTVARIRPVYPQAVERPYPQMVSRLAAAPQTLEGMDRCRGRADVPLRCAWLGMVRPARCRAGVGCAGWVVRAMSDWRWLAQTPEHPHFIARVLAKAALLFVVVNLAFALLNPLDVIGAVSLYNGPVPGRVRLPYGEDPRAYNLSLNNL